MKFNYRLVRIFRLVNIPSFVNLLRKDIVSGFVASGVAGYQLAIFMSYLGLHLKNFAAIPLIIGFVFLSRNLFQLFLRIPLGELTQIVGRKPMIVSGIGLQTISFVIMYLAINWVYVLVATIFVAFGMAFYWPAMFAYIGDISTNNYGKINGLIFMGSDIGVVLGSLFSSYLLNQNIVGISGLFGYGAVIGIIGFIVVQLTLARVLKEEDRKKVENIWKALWNSLIFSFQSLSRMMKIKPLNLVYTFQFVISFAEYFFNSFFPLLLVLYLGFTEANVAYVLFIATSVIFVFKPFLGSISDRFGFRKPVIFGLVLVSILLFILTYVTSLTIIIVLYSIIISASLMNYLAVNGGTSYASPTKERGLAMGVLGFWVSTGRSSSSLILSPIWEFLERNSGDPALSLAILFRIASILILISSLFLLLISRNMDKASIGQSN